MDIILGDEALRPALGFEREAARRWGKECAERLCQRLVEIAAADCLASLATLPGPQLRMEDGTGRFALSLGPDHVLRCEALRPDDTTIQTTDNGANGDTVIVRILAVEARDAN